MIRHRTMSPEELQTVLDWAADEGWNPGLDDAAAFHAADPEGFFLALDGDRPVAAISVVNHGPDFAFLGLYLCRPSHRGQGIGLELWRHALAHAGERTVGLDGVPDQQANYARSGFTHAGGTTRYSGRVEPREGQRMRAATAADIPQLLRVEATASGWEKPAYLSTWFTDTPNRRTIVCEAGGRISGLATVRACRTGAKIGPLVAADEAMALDLVAHAATLFGDEIVIDVPATSPTLDRLCRGLALEPGFSTARMYRGKPGKPPADLFAVATLELG